MCVYVIENDGEWTIGGYDLWDQWTDMYRRGIRAILHEATSLDPSTFHSPYDVGVATTKSDRIKIRALVIQFLKG